MLLSINIKFKMLASLLLIGCTIQAQGQSCENCFVTTWDTQADGQAGNRTIMLPITEGRYDVDVNNDGDFDDAVDFRDLIGIQPITFATAGRKTIAVRPNAANTEKKLRINHKATGSTPQKLISIDNWGDIVWTSMGSAFRYCSNMTLADNIGVPNLTMVTDMWRTFEDATSFNGNLSSWDVSQVTDMRRTFSRATGFNGDISGWNVSKVTNMLRMFSGAKNFTNDLSGWDISNVTDMDNMFKNATSFTSENYDALLTGWTKDGKTPQRDVPFGAPPTTYCLGEAGRDILTGTYNWDIEGDMGLRCPVAPFVTTWNTQAGDPGNATIMLPISGGAYDVDTSYDGTTFNADMPNQTGTIEIDFGVGNAGVHTIAVRPNAANTNNRLRIDHSITGSTPQKLVSIKKWGGIVWTSMENAFRGCSNMTIKDDAGVPDLSEVTNMDNMFRGAKNLTGSLEDWNVSNITSMVGAFAKTEHFTGSDGNISTWNVSNVTDMAEMFSSAIVFNGSLKDWNVSNVTNMTNMLKDATSFSSENYDALLTGWSALTPQNDVVFGAPPTTYCIDGKAGRDILTGTYGWDIIGDTICPFVTTWDTEEGTGQTGNTTIMLPIVSGAYDVDINNDGTFEMTNQTGSTTIDFGTGNAGTHTIAVIPNPADIGGQLRINHSAIGSTPQKLTSIDKWGGIVWTSMENAFRGCSNMTIAEEGAGAPDLTEVSDMSSMFSYAINFNSDLSSWDVSNVTDMSRMFSSARNFNGDLSNWNVSNVTGMSFMFSWATEFNSDLSSWDVSNVTDMAATFFSAEKFNSDISSWNVSNVYNMSGAFVDTWDFNSDLSRWNVSNAVTMGLMFQNAYSFNSDISSWNVSNVFDMAYMFEAAWDFNQDLSSWNVSNVFNMEHMFTGATSFSSENYDALLKGWSGVDDMDREAPQSNVRFGVPPTTYCTGQDGRMILKNRYMWTITGDMGYDCTPPGIAHNTPFLDIENYSNNDDVFLDTRIYPNPTRGKLSIESPFSIEKLELYNILGAKLFSVSKTNTLDLASLRQGIYILKAFSTDRVISKKIIKN